MHYDVLAFIGRFQPFHNGHKKVVDTALEQAKKVAIVLGSHDQPRNTRNPFTTAERIEMISAVYPNEVAEGRIMFVPQVDHTYNLERWIAGVQTGVSTVANTPFTPDPVNIGLIGHSKDHTSFYLKSFPTWGNIEVPNVERIDATTARSFYFHKHINRNGYLNAMVPDQVAAWLDGFRRSEGFELITSELAHVHDYKSQFADLKYPPTFHTVDAVVVQSGHVLLVKRRAEPGKGLWALPGGFLDQSETLEEGMLRELREETRIGVPLPVLRGSIQKHEVFDDPHRSARGRTITTAYHVDLQDREELPEIKGSDDAEKARWVPLSEVRRNMLFEDHYDIIETLVGL